MEVLAIVPARGGSKGIPRKNIKLLNNRPLIYYSIKAGQDSKYVTRTVVSTEDEEIKQVALRDCGCEVVDRPMELAVDTASTIVVLQQVVKFLEEKENYHPDVVVLLQATCPMRDSKQIDEAFEIFLNNDCDSVFAVRDIGKTHGYWAEMPDKKTYVGLYDYRHRPRRQDTDKHRRLLAETGSIYIIKTDIMKKVNDFIGENPRVYESPESIDIDNPEDFKTIENVLISK